MSQIHAKNDFVFRFSRGSKSYVLNFVKRFIPNSNSDKVMHLLHQIIYGVVNGISIDCNLNIFHF